MPHSPPRRRPLSPIRRARSPPPYLTTHRPGPFRPGGGGPLNGAPGGGFRDRSRSPPPSNRSDYGRRDPYDNEREGRRRSPGPGGYRGGPSSISATAMAGGSNTGSGWRERSPPGLYGGRDNRGGYDRDFDRRNDHRRPHSPPPGRRRSGRSPSPPPPHARFPPGAGPYSGLHRDGRFDPPRIPLLARIEKTVPPDMSELEEGEVPMEEDELMQAGGVAPPVALDYSDETAAPLPPSLASRDLLGRMARTSESQDRSAIDPAKDQSPVSRAAPPVSMSLSSKATTTLTAPATPLPIQSTNTAPSLAPPKSPRPVAPTISSTSTSQQRPPSSPAGLPARPMSNSLATPSSPPAPSPRPPAGLSARIAPISLAAPSVDPVRMPTDKPSLATSLSLPARPRPPIRNPLRSPSPPPVALPTRASTSRPLAESEPHLRGRSRSRSPIDQDHSPPQRSPPPHPRANILDRDRERDRVRDYRPAFDDPRSISRPFLSSRPSSSRSRRSPSPFTYDSRSRLASSPPNNSNRRWERSPSPRGLGGSARRGGYDHYNSDSRPLRSPPPTRPTRSPSPPFTRRRSPGSSRRSPPPHIQPTGSSSHPLSPLPRQSSKRDSFPPVHASRPGRSETSRSRSRSRSRSISVSSNRDSRLASHSPPPPPRQSPSPRKTSHSNQSAAFEDPSAALSGNYRGRGGGRGGYGYGRGGSGFLSSRGGGGSGMGWGNASGSGNAVGTGGGGSGPRSGPPLPLGPRTNGAPPTGPSQVRSRVPWNERQPAATTVEMEAERQRAFVRENDRLEMEKIKQAKEEAERRANEPLGGKEWADKIRMLEERKQRRLKGESEIDPPKKDVPKEVAPLVEDVTMKEPKDLISPTPEGVATSRADPPPLVDQPALVLAPLIVAEPPATLPPPPMAIPVRSASSSRAPSPMHSTMALPARPPLPDDHPARQQPPLPRPAVSEHRINTHMVPPALPPHPPASVALNKHHRPSMYPARPSRHSDDREPDRTGSFRSSTTGPSLINNTSTASSSIPVSGGSASNTRPPPSLPPTHLASNPPSFAPSRQSSYSSSSGDGPNSAFHYRSEHPLPASQSQQSASLASAASTPSLPRPSREEVMRAEKDRAEKERMDRILMALSPPEVDLKLSFGKLNGMGADEVELVKIRHMLTLLKGDRTHLSMAVWKASTDLRDGELELAGIEERKKVAEAGIARTEGGWAGVM